MSRNIPEISKNDKLLLNDLNDPSFCEWHLKYFHFVAVSHRIYHIFEKGGEKSSKKIGQFFVEAKNWKVENNRS